MYFGRPKLCVCAVRRETHHAGVQAKRPLLFLLCVCAVLWQLWSVKPKRKEPHRTQLFGSARDRVFRVATKLKNEGTELGRSILEPKALGRRFTQTLWQAPAGGGFASWMTDVAPIGRCLGHSWRLWPPLLVSTLPDLNSTGAWDRPAPLTKTNETPPYIYMVTGPRGMRGVLTKIYMCISI